MIIQQHHNKHAKRNPKQNQPQRSFQSKPHIHLLLSVYDKRRKNCHSGVFGKAISTTFSSFNSSSALDGLNRSTKSGIISSILVMVS